MLVALKRKSTISKLKSQLLSESEMKDLEKAKRVLDMEIDRDKKKSKVSLTQKGYLQKVLRKFNIQSDTKSFNTPLTPHFKLAVTLSLKSVEEREYMSHVLYASAMSSLMYATVCTKLDLSQAVSMVSRYIHDLGKG